MSRAEEAEPLGRDSWDTWDSAGTSSAVDAILHVLTVVLRRDLGFELMVALRVRLSCSSQVDRANIAAVVDDIFHVSPDTHHARAWALNVLDDSAQMEAVMSYWPGYPVAEHLSYPAMGAS